LCAGDLNRDQQRAKREDDECQRRGDESLKQSFCPSRVETEKAPTKPNVESMQHPHCDEGKWNRKKWDHPKGGPEIAPEHISLIPSHRCDLQVEKPKGVDMHQEGRLWRRYSAPKQLECVLANCRAWSRFIGQRRELNFAPSGGIVERSKLWVKRRHSQALGAFPL